MVYERKGLTSEQQRILLLPLAPHRVLKLEHGNEASYLTQADVRAHLIRIFGFGNFSINVTNIETLDMREVPRRRGDGTNWQVICRATVALYLPDPDATYEDVAVGEAQNPNLGAAFDQASKAAVSQALKRAAVNLGDQFGLSLYFDGSIEPVVRITAVGAPAADGATDVNPDRKPVPEP